MAELNLKLPLRQFRSSPHRSLQVDNNHDYVFLLANAYVNYLRIDTLRCQPKQMARAWRRALESTNGSCVIERLHVKMVSAGNWVVSFRVEKGDART